MEIRVENITKKYGDNNLFENYSVTINNGEITCIYGCSGCGKSTFINIIGQIEPYEGKIFYDGVELTNKRMKRKFLKNNIAFIFQDFGLLENKSVLENMYIVNSAKSKTRSELNEVLESVNLYNILEKKVYQLSGGEKQRVSIARAILKNSNIILADEPTGSVDEKNEELIMDIFKDMRRKGKTVIIASHSKKIIALSDHQILF